MKRYILIPVLFILGIVYSCKKVDDANRYNQALPSINGGFDKNGYITGDTLLIGGRLFYETGTLKVHIGNADGEIVAHSQSTTDYYGNKVLFDQVRIVLTPEMGVGNNIPVTITANGHSIDAAPINISQYIPVAGATDTTLFVEKLLTWAPDDLSRYQFTDTSIRNRPQVFTLPTIVRATVNRSGEISFFNPVGVFKVEGTQVTPVVEEGDSFTENSQQFSIRYIVGATNSSTPNIFYFSAEVLEANHDIKVALIYRLCKFDAASGVITTLNRSEVQNFPVSGPIDPRPFQGDAASVKLVACSLREGANGDLFFLNSFTLSSTHATLDRWHKQFIRQQVARGDGHNNLCRYKDGQILSLFSDHNKVDALGLQAPGVNYTPLDDYLLSPDGNNILVSNPSGNLDKYVMYDLGQNAPLYSIGERVIRLKSFDDNPASRFPYSASTISVNYGFAVPLPGLAVNFSLNGAILPNGNLVFRYGTSMGAFDYLANNGYCYAGEEIGFGGQGTPQAKDIGKANHVDFFNKLVFGIDKLLDFYFFVPDLSVSPATVTFYKMSSRK